jgi:transposase
VIDGKVVKEVRTFSTTTVGLMALSEWLAENKCTQIAMEATGVYWKPVWHILSDGEFELVLANAAHVKNVPGRKTDVKDADWVSDLLAHGLIRASFVPDNPTQEMRTLLRTRKQLVREQSSHILRIQKTLEDANIKLDSVISDVLGVSGRAMIEALIAGEHSPSKLARLANHRVKASQGTLREALRGHVKEHHRFLLRLHLNQIDALDAAIAEIDAQVEAGIAPFRTAVEQVASIPGVKNLGARTIISEIGIDMNALPPMPISSPGLASARAATRVPASADRPAFARAHLGSRPHWCSAHGRRPARKAATCKLSSTASELGAAPKKAILAVAASILTAIYHMLKDGTLYRDLGPNHFDARSKERQKNRLVRRLAELGYTVELAPITH